MSVRVFVFLNRSLFMHTHTTRESSVFKVDEFTKKLFDIYKQIRLDNKQV